MSQVKIFTTQWCAYCRAEKQFLDQKKVKYTAVDVEADPVAAQEMIRLTSQMGVPVTLITHDDGSKAAVVGFDRDWLSRELRLR
ncbi:MAG TPA: glutaredoxin domain-containing protein [Candidatus Saccharimonas sp.]|nr:glutaredoxin domain-containing protein [Candidatus Saccharimonas sp.]